MELLELTVNRLDGKQGIIWSGIIWIVCIELVPSLFYPNFNYLKIGHTNMLFDDRDVESLHLSRSRYPNRALAYSDIAQLRISMLGYKYYPELLPVT